MSYNNNENNAVTACNVLIITKSGESENIFRARGLYYRSGSCVHVRYRQENDLVVLNINEHGLEMKKGSFLELHFHPKESAKAVLKYEGQEGNFEVYTSAFSFTFLEQIRIFLDYELRFSHDIQKFSLQIFIQSISEEK